MITFLVVAGFVMVYFVVAWLVDSVFQAFRDENSDERE